MANIIKMLYVAKVGIFVIMAVFLMSSVVLPATYYVNALNGDNIDDGLSPSTAWKTIKQVKPGDKIIYEGYEIGTGQISTFSASVL